MLLALLFLVTAFLAVAEPTERDTDNTCSTSDDNDKVGGFDHEKSLRLLEIASPVDRGQFQGGSIPIDCRVPHGGTAKVCWKLLFDPACMGTEGGSRSARELLARDAPYHGCAKPPMKGNLKLSASCWILQFDLIDGTERVIDTEYRGIEMVTVDGLVEELYPNISRVPGGEMGIITKAMKSRGMGMILEFGLGAGTTPILSRLAGANEKVHSFDSLLGLPEKWREGFDKGKFSMGGKIPSFALELSDVDVHVGLVNETLPSFLESKPIEPVGLLVLDLCLEAGTAYVLDHLVCRLYEGSIVLFGSYFNFPGWTENLGERSAWLSAVEKWGIHFEVVGFHSTFLMIKITERPEKCPGREAQGSENLGIREWTRSKIDRARAMWTDDQGAALAVSVLEEVIAVDPNNAEALNYLSYALKDIRRIADRFDYARRALTLQHQMPPPGTDAVTMLTCLHKDISFEMRFDRSVRVHRLWHDVQQLRLLRARDRLPPDLAEDAIQAYEGTLAQFPDATKGDMVKLSWDQWATLGPYFNRVLHLPVLSRVPGGALNPAIDFTEISAAYKSSDPHIVVVDDFFSAEALRKLQQYYQEATIFYDWHHESYLGAYTADGAGNPVLAQVIEELAEKMRPIICDRPLVQGWVYKYDETLDRGIRTHADEAAVNFNVWLGENGSLEPDRGGLVIYTTKPPDDWDFEKFNQYPLAPEAVAMLERSHYKNITVPYKQNRMMMFDSQLFHQSDVGRWKEGYESRRINLTLLFGRKGSSCEI